MWTIVADYCKISFEDHYGCCNVTNGDARIEEIKKFVERIETQGSLFHPKLMRYLDKRKMGHRPSVI